MHPRAGAVSFGAEEIPSLTSIERQVRRPYELGKDSARRFWNRHPEVYPMNRTRFAGSLAMT
jgi:hypothetical protein